MLQALSIFKNYASSIGLPGCAIMEHMIFCNALAAGHIFFSFRPVDASWVYTIWYTSRRAEQYWKILHSWASDTEEFKFISDYSKCTVLYFWQLGPRTAWYLMTCDILKSYEISKHVLLCEVWTLNIARKSAAHRLQRWGPSGPTVTPFGPSQKCCPVLFVLLFKFCVKLFFLELPLLHSSRFGHQVAGGHKS